MKYLFYDIESSNGNRYEASICSFGYVETDENFNIIEEKDIIINPVTDFSEYVIEVVGLAYHVSDFKSALRFKDVYKIIHDKLSQADLVFGFDIQNVYMRYRGR